MATPHVAAAAALLLELHPTWTPEEVKSALVSTAGPAWADTARTQEAPVTLEGGGLVALPGAADPQLFTDPVSLSFEDLNVLDGAASRALLVRLTDAGDGAGTWQVELMPQAATAGATVDVTGTVSIPPGGELDLPVVARAAAGSASGEDYGFVVLRKGAVTRRIPYFFLVDHPALASAPVVKLAKSQSGDTRNGVDRVDAYRYPVAPFGNTPDAPAMVEDGARDRLRHGGRRARRERRRLRHPGDPRRARSTRGTSSAEDENTVQGYAGTPVDVNALTYDYLAADRGGRRLVPAPADVLRLGRLGHRPVHRPQRAGSLRAALVGERRHAADGEAPDDARLRRAADDRPADVRLAVRRRPALADDRLSRSSRRRHVVRPGHRGRRVPAAGARAAAEAGQRSAAHGLLRLPGGEEHRHGRAVDHAEHAHGHD